MNIDEVKDAYNKHYNRKDLNVVIEMFEIAILSAANRGESLVEFRFNTIESIDDNDVKYIIKHFKNKGFVVCENYFGGKITEIIISGWDSE